MSLFSCWNGQKWLCLVSAPSLQGGNHLRDAGPRPNAGSVRRLRSKPKKAAPPAPPVQEDPKPVAPKAAAPMPIAPKPAEPKPAESKPETPAPRAPRAPRPERPPHQPKADKPLAPKPEKVFAPAAPGSVEEKIETFLKGLLERMGSTAVPMPGRTNLKSTRWSSSARIWVCSSVVVGKLWTPSST